MVGLSTGEIKTKFLLAHSRRPDAAAHRYPVLKCLRSKFLPPVVSLKGIPHLVILSSLNNPASACCLYFKALLSPSKCSAKLYWYVVLL